LKDNGQIIVEEQDEKEEEKDSAIDTTPSVQLKKEVIKGKAIFYLSKRPTKLAYGSRSGASLKSKEQGGHEGQFYYQCIYEGIPFAVHADEPFIADLDRKNLGEVTLLRTAEGYDLLGYIPKDIYLAMKKEEQEDQLVELDMDLRKAKLEFAKKAMDIKNFTFDASNINEMVGL
jgi:hypothetical protein